MIQDLDTVVLARDVPAHGLRSGDLGTVVLSHDGEGYEVEFTTLAGATVAVLSLAAGDIRKAEASEIAHARRVEQPAAE